MSIKKFPKIMKAQRKAYGISMAELSRITMVSEQTLYKYERGKLIPTLTVFLRLCAVLKINPQYFLQN